MYRQFVFLLLILFTTAIIACDKPVEIRKYKVAKSRSDLGDIGLSRQPTAPSETQRPTFQPVRMVVAIAERDDATWFFKLTGPVAAIEESKTVWNQLLKDIAFGDDSKPAWETPKGWKPGPARQFRFATLTTLVDGKGEVELAISSLGPNQDLLSNVNRWLGQLQLPPITKDDLQLDVLKTTYGEAKLFDETGMMRTSASMMSSPQTSKRTAESGLIYDVPEGWTEGRPNSIVKVRLKKGDSETAPQITVTQLLAAANEWIPNAQRWARQVEMDDSEEYAGKETVEVTIDKLPGKKIRLIPDDESSKFAMIGVMVVRDDLAWFLKVIGDRQEIIDSEIEFDEFVNSFRFE